MSGLALSAIRPHTDLNLNGMAPLISHDVPESGMCLSKSACAHRCIGIHTSAQGAVCSFCISFELRSLWRPHAHGSMRSHRPTRFSLTA
eukprot:scaffold300447_cov33-Tisochrysis_lutea.AAC.2